MSEQIPTRVVRPPLKIIEYGNYFLIEKIATGGMAEIFRAKRRGLEGFEKLVAVKRILPHFSSNDEFISMFIQEAKVAALLTHPNIVQIYDLGKVEDSFYIAMEYVSGRDLRTILKRLRERAFNFNIEQIVYIISKVCSGLDHAHRKKDLKGNELNLVHRDVSPQNILLSYEGEIKIVDFGIAKAASQTSETRAGVLKGKIAYMSPEQAWGRPLDLRSDIFSTGILLYELLTGDRLFKGDSDLNTLEMVRACRIAPPTHLNQNIPEQLEGVVLRALAEDVNQRYQRAGDMQADLEKYLFSGRYDPEKINLYPAMQQLFEAEINHEAQVIKDMEELFFLSDRHEEKTMMTSSVTGLEAKEERLQKVVDLEGTPSSLKAPLPHAITPATSPSLAAAPPRAAPPRVAPPQAPPPRMAPPSSPQPAADYTIAKPVPAPAKSKALLAGVAAGIVLLLAVAVGAYFFMTSSSSTSRDKAPSGGALAGSSSASKAAVSPPGLLKAMVTVNSTPPGAAVLVNEQPASSPTPATVDQLEAGREYTVKVRKEGFNEWSTKVTPKAGERVQLNAALAPAAPRLMGTLSVDAKPWAQVLVDGQPKGTTPLAAVNLPVGKHRVLLRNPELKAEESFEVNIEAGKTVSRVVNLVKVQKAFLNINAKPWADVYIDGKKIGTTPLAEVAVNAGGHTVRLFNPTLNKEQIVKVDLTPNQKKDINVTLK